MLLFCLNLTSILRPFYKEDFLLKFWLIFKLSATENKYLFLIRTDGFFKANVSCHHLNFSVPLLKYKLSNLSHLTLSVFRLSPFRTVGMVHLLEQMIGFEPMNKGFADHSLKPLEYICIYGVGNGNRTHIINLEDWCINRYTIPTYYDVA